MAVPTATATVVGGPLTLTAYDPVGTVVVTDTGDPYTPVATDRTVEVNGTAVVEDAAVVAEVGFCAAGTYPVNINVVNDDGTGDSSAVNVVVTDALADLENIGTGPGEVRIRPSQLPWEYRDAMQCTPGLPTAQGVFAARAHGTVLATADQGNVVVDGVAQVVSLA